MEILKKIICCYYETFAHYCVYIHILIAHAKSSGKIEVSH